MRVCRQRGMRTLSLTPSRPLRAPGLRAQYGLDRTLPTHEGRSRRATVAPRANFSRPRCSLFPACSARPACSRGRRAGPQLPPRFRPIRPLAGPRGSEAGAAGPRPTSARGSRTTSGGAVHRTRGGRATRCQSRSHGPVGRRREHSRTPAPRAPRAPSIPMSSRQWCGCAPRPRRLGLRPSQCHGLVGSGRAAESERGVRDTHAGPRQSGPRAHARSPRAGRAGPQLLLRQSDTRPPRPQNNVSFREFSGGIARDSDLPR